MCDLQFIVRLSILFCLACDQAGYAYIWDSRESNTGNAVAPSAKFKLHNNTCALRMDQNIFDENSLAFGSMLDSSLLTYDLRNTNMPKAFVKGAHYSTITSVKFSPHTQHLIATSSTDRTLRIWDMREGNSNSQEQQQQQKPNTQTNEPTMQLENSYGGKVSSFKSQKLEDWVNDIDWNVHEVGLMAMCCNDHLVKAYNVRED